MTILHVFIFLVTWFAYNGNGQLAVDSLQIPNRTQQECDTRKKLFDDKNKQLPIPGIRGIKSVCIDQSMDVDTTSPPTKTTTPPTKQDDETDPDVLPSRPATTEI